jgi:hypothetical protein
LFVHNVCPARETKFRTRRITVMEESSLSPSQVLVITNIEYLIDTLFSEPDTKFSRIIELVDQNNITALEEMMQYFWSLLRSKGYPEYAILFAEKYKLQVEDSPSCTGNDDPLKSLHTDVMKNLTKN